MSDFDFDRFLSEQRKHVRVYEVAYGDPLDAACWWCGAPVLYRRRDSLTNPVAFPHNRALLIHHLDEDHSNNEPTNLVATHWGCHSSHHDAKRAAGMSPEELSQRSREGGVAGGRLGGRRRMSSMTPEQRSDFGRVGFIAQRKGMTPEDQQEWHRQGALAGHAKKLPDGRSVHAVVTGQKGAFVTRELRYRCGGCDKISTPGALGMHQKHTGHTGRTRLS